LQLNVLPTDVGEDEQSIETHKQRIAELWAFTNKDEADVALMWDLMRRTQNSRRALFLQQIRPRAILDQYPILEDMTQVGISK
jgi:hypothetical protein